LHRQSAKQCEMMTRDLVLIGGGSHCRTCIDVIESEGIDRIAGIVAFSQKRARIYWLSIYRHG
jgi:hypothetical protein